MLLINRFIWERKTVVVVVISLFFIYTRTLSIVNSVKESSLLLPFGPPTIKSITRFDIGFDTILQKPSAIINNLSY